MAKKEKQRKERALLLPESRESAKKKKKKKVGFRKNLYILSNSNVSVSLLSTYAFIRKLHHSKER
jgi:hypothetical protein